MTTFALVPWLSRLVYQSCYSPARLYFPILFMSGTFIRESSCRSVDTYDRLNFVSEGTYGVVFRARDSSNAIHALKQIKLAHPDKSGFPITALREATILLSLSHPNVVSVSEVVVGHTSDKFYLVMEYAGQDLCTLLERLQRAYAPAELKSLMRMLLSGVSYLHENWVIHRDLKPSNLLVNGDGVLKICDFGLARRYADPLGAYTPGVVTLWYRAPELLLGAKKYSTAVDMWAVGCIFAELLMGQPLFAGTGELDQLSRIADTLGRPCGERWTGFEELPNVNRLSFRAYPEASSLREKVTEMAGAGRITNAALHLLEEMLQYDPERRISAEHALKHQYFREAPVPKEPHLIQTLPEEWRGIWGNG